MKIFIKLSFFLITIIFIFITSKAQSRMFARPPGSDCDKYLKERGWVRGENKRKSHDGKSRFFIVGVGHSYLSHYERDEQGKEKKIKLIFNFENKTSELMNEKGKFKSKDCL